jgi:pyruvate, orthophosphate dikinase
VWYIHDSKNKEQLGTKTIEELMAEKLVYFFGNGSAEGTGAMKDVLGGKGAGLAEMTNLGLPVPPGFTVTAAVCRDYYKLGEKFPERLRSDVETNLARLEESMGQRFGDPQNPLLVSVRSGARVSMPGMMDTVLNLGLNDQVAEGLAKKGNPRFAYDSYRRFVQMYSKVVLDMDSEIFEEMIDEAKEDLNITQDVDIPADTWKLLTKEFKAKVKERLGKTFPEDPKEQLWGAIGAVFHSWKNDRAVKYRQIYNIPEDWGTALNIQSMVFGNLGQDCATGVAFTRDPNTGEKRFYGEWLENAQGEDVVAGIRTPHPIISRGDGKSMEENMPTVYAELRKVEQRLEGHFKEMQDIEFTIQNNKLYMLQCRTGKRTSRASIRIAVEMVREGLIDKNMAISRVAAEQLEQLLHPMIDPKAKLDVIARGLAASPGAASGRVVFSADEAETKAKAGERIILVRVETSPEDIHGMNAAEGILTARGGLTSHAAVVARGMGKCCVAGCSEITVDYQSKTFTTYLGLVVKEGDFISLDGAKGLVVLGDVPRIVPELGEDYNTFMGWVDATRTLKVRANADTPRDAKVAREFGAEGIGLCRTEHMFFDEGRIDAVREMILADDEAGRKRALEKIIPMQRADFEGIFREMKGLPVTIRLLDPPLHEFLPHTKQEFEELSKKIGIPKEKLERASVRLAEANPMLGHRGCRLGITFPEIYDAQVRAIAEAAVKLVKDEGFTIIPEIMIPLVATEKELEILRANTIRVFEEITKAAGVQIEYLVGTMIELPRAALCADSIAKQADFFSFGTNDLTQTTIGLSRDDAGKFLGAYREMGIFTRDPFVTLDQEGVGQLVKMGVEKGRTTKPNLKCGICGEHGGDPDSIAFCHRTGLDYVSCSPFRVPVARLAAAQAALKK